MAQKRPKIWGVLITELPLEPEFVLAGFSLPRAASDSDA